MLTLLAARLDRTGNILVNGRLDGYPAYFHVQPQAIYEALGLPADSDQGALQLLQQQWPRFDPALERLVRRFGNDFLATATLLQMK